MISPYLGDGWIAKLRIRYNQIEVIETPITRRGVEDNTEGVSVTLLEVDICVVCCFLILELLFEPKIELTFEVKFVQFRDVRLVFF